MSSIFANNLKSLRIDNDYSQNDIASKLGINRSRYSNYENGISEPPLDILIKISNFFNCTIDDLLKTKISTTILKEPTLSVSLNEFDSLQLKKKLLKHKAFYEKKKKTILNEIDNKIDEIDDLIDYLNTYNKNLKEEFSDDITPNVIQFTPKEKNDYRAIDIIGKVSAGNPCYAYEEIVGHINIPKKHLCDSKDYFILEIKGDSMNKLFNPGDLILVEKTNLINNNDIIVALIENEATCKKINFCLDEIALIPQSSNPIHKTKFYKPNDIHISGKVIKNISDYYKE